MVASARSNIHHLPGLLPFADLDPWSFQSRCGGPRSAAGRGADEKPQLISSTRSDQAGIGMKSGESVTGLRGGGKSDSSHAGSPVCPLSSILYCSSAHMTGVRRKANLLQHRTRKLCVMRDAQPGNFPSRTMVSFPSQGLGNKGYLVVKTSGPTGECVRDWPPVP